MNSWIPFFLVGGFQSHIAAVLIGSTLTPPLLMMNPRYSVSHWRNLHFDGLSFIPCFRIVRMMAATSFWCCSRLSEYMRTSSRYTMQHISIYDCRVLLIHLWNAAGALVSPTGITKYSYVPYVVVKVVFHSSPSLILTL